jgi:hypothetical protein
MVAAREHCRAGRCVTEQPRPVTFMSAIAI